MIKKCKWDYGKKAPVMLMIDDFANKRISINRRGGGDWGNACEEKNSFYDILYRNILKPFPEVKVTLFLVVGKRTPIVVGGLESYAYSIDEGEKFPIFLKKISENDRLELAYHGFDHGELKDGNFVQEWRCFKTLDDALTRIISAKQLYRKVTGKQFRGGKYCGYSYNSFSDESIAKTGFDWWCRNYQSNQFKIEESPDFSLNVFGERNVIDVPTTIDGNFYSLRNKKVWKHPRELAKAALNKIKYGLTLEKELKYLLENQYIISIQEHSSPAREDGKTQYPNIMTDMDNLQYIFTYLRDYDCWYATGTEIANYYRVYKETKLSISRSKVILEIDDSRIIGNYICLENENPKENIDLWMPQNSIEKIGDNRFRVKILDKKMVLNMECAKCQN